MRTGHYYKLKVTVKTECQGHHFTFPSGTVLRLDDVYEREVCDPPRYVTDHDGETVEVYDSHPVVVHAFESVPQGYCLNLDPEDVTPASAVEVWGAKPTVVHREPCERFSPVF